MEHEKEPWKAIPGWVADSRQVRPWDIVNSNGGDSIATTTLLENDEANARRIVACVNACAGIPTEGLENSGFSRDVLLKIAELKQQRDEYKKDAERYRHLKENSLGPRPAYCVTVNIGHDWSRVSEIDELDEVLDAALAKVKP